MSDLLMMGCGAVTGGSIYWVITSGSNVAYAGIRSATFAQDNILSGGTGGRVFLGVVIGERCRQDGKIRQVKVRSNGAASGCYFETWYHNGTNYTRRSQSNSVNLSGAGTETFTLTTELDCEVGDYLGIRVPTTGGSILDCTNASSTPGILWSDEPVSSPHTFANSINNLSLDLDGLGKPPFLSVTGDSIIEGHNTATQWHGHMHSGSGIDGNTAAEVANALRGLYSPATLEYQNFGLGGQDFAWVDSTGIDAAALVAPTAIIIHSGVNDVANGRSWSAIETNLNSIKTKLNGAHLFVNEILPWTNGNDTQAGTIRTYNTNLATWCAANSATLISCHNAMGQIRVSTGQLDDLLAAYDQDGVHLTTAGVAALAALIKTALDGYY